MCRDKIIFIKLKHLIKIKSTKLFCKIILFQKSISIMQKQKLTNKQRSNKSISICKSLTCSYHEHPLFNLYHQQAYQTQEIFVFSVQFYKICLPLLILDRKSSKLAKISKIKRQKRKYLRLKQQNYLNFLSKKIYNPIMLIQGSLLQGRKRKQHLWNSSSI